MTERKQNQNNLPNYLRDADFQEGHDYELDALRERDELGLNNDFGYEVEDEDNEPEAPETDPQTQARAKAIFDALLEQQKDHMQELYDSCQWYRRTHDQQRYNNYNDKISVIVDFLTAGECGEIVQAFRDILYTYNANRYNQEQKPMDDVLLNK